MLFTKQNFALIASMIAVIKKLNIEFLKSIINFRERKKTIEANNLKINKKYKQKS